MDNKFKDKISFMDEKQLERLLHNLRWNEYTYVQNILFKL